MTVSPTRVARQAQSSTPFRALARAGYAANGVVHILIGVLVLSLASGAGGGESDQSGAFKAIAEAPLGVFALWAVAVTLWALGLWHAAHGFVVRGDGAAKTWGRRVSEWGQAVVFVALGVAAASVAVGGRPDGEQSAEGASSGVLAIPGGPVLLGVVGLAIAGGGVAFVVMGVLRSFRKRVSIPSGSFGKALTALGVVGYVAKGVALMIVGILALVAAVTLDPQAAGGLDGAVQALLSAPFGKVLAAVIGAGFMAYGVFCVFRARYANLDA